MDEALRELDRYSAMTEREKSDFNMSDDLRATTEISPTSAMAAAGKSQTTSSSAKSMFGSGGPGKSLLDIWTSRIERKNSRKHVPFAGLRNVVGDKARLYLSLENKQQQATAAAAAAHDMATE